MELTNKQAEALDLIIQKYEDNAPYVVIRGYRGTGKTTLIKFFVQKLLTTYNLNYEDIVYTSFTGKAVQVMVNKGNTNAFTLHKLLYDYRPLADGTLIRLPKERIEAKVIVCDEVSMVSKELVDLLLSHGIFTVFCGDPGQLPPIDPNDNNHLLDNPDIFFDEIMRQAADSGIIQLSMKVRKGEDISNFDSEDALVIPRAAITDEMLLWADIVLCATNKTKNEINQRIRKLLGKKGIIDDHEKIICNHNYWDMVSGQGEALTNGTIGYLDAPKEKYFPVFSYVGVPNNKIYTINGNFISETNQSYGIIDIDKSKIETGNYSLNNQQLFLMKKNKKLRGKIPFDFEYANSITVHRAQGSEWNKVLVIEERFPFGADEHKRWVYTAITRASSRLILAR